jgi:hypothetical protein
MTPCSAPAARRDRGCAEQWESRSCARAPCHAGRRRTTMLVLLCCFIPRPSVVNQRGARAAHTSRRVEWSIDSSVRRRTPHLPSGAGGACGTAPVSDVERRYATAYDLDLWTLHHCSLHRAVGNPTCSSCLTWIASSRREGLARRCRAYFPAAPHALRAHARPRARTSSRRTGMRRRAVG